MAFERVPEANDLKTVLALIQDYDLPREALPTQWLKEAAVSAFIPLRYWIENLKPKPLE
ncbi:MAG: hypothetical protein Q9P01_22610 [Anaerolineae bacterium]|nr:hypothetical protein [Anaerolineae bacterium]